MKSSGIGGQAVLEGVMMKNEDYYAVAVRKPDNGIEIKKDEFHGIGDRGGLFRLPILRGVAAFVDSLVLGIRALTYSSGFSEEEEKEKEKTESRAKETLADIGVVILSVFMAVVVFILLPLLLSNFLGRLVRSVTLQLLLEGVLRIVMFVAYVVMVSRLEDIKRVFMYHGAEHKCINCVESGAELTVANAKGQSRNNKRCGTSFLLFVMLVSFVLFMFIRIRTPWLRYVLRIVLIPVIAGISYEFVRLAGSSDSKLVGFLNKPGMLLQKLTTREPDDSMLEVAIASVEAVFNWRAYQESEGIAKPRIVEKKKSAKEWGQDLKEEEKETADELSSLDRLFHAPSKKENEGFSMTRGSRSLSGAKNSRRAGSNKQEASAGGRKDDNGLRTLDNLFVYEDKGTLMRDNRGEREKE